jgi:hypothetical protein
MSLGRAVAAVGVAFALAFAILTWHSRESAAPAEETAVPSAARAAAAVAPVAAVASSPRSARRAAPMLASAPFDGREMAISSDGPEAPVVALRSSALSGRDLSIELATRALPADGKPVFATVSVSDALGNTILDCVWRDVEIGGDARKLDCELPEGVELPLTVSGHQRSAPSFVETPSVAAVDPGVRP